LWAALDTTAAAASQATSESFRQLFNVQLPCTVYVRAAHCQVDVRRQAGEPAHERVELRATLRAAFGWEFSTDQDSEGVYIVAKRKPVVGALANARFTLTVPSGAHLVLHLTPGSVHLVDFDGKITLEGASQDETGRQPQGRAISTSSARARSRSVKEKPALGTASVPLLPEGARSRPARRASAQEK
jgi:hypothetical protein